MTTYARRLAVAASALAVVAALGACSDDPEPNFADPTPSGPTTSATDDEPTPPELPAAAEKMDKAGAIAFAKFYWKSVNYAQSTGDTEALRLLATTTCKACDGGIESIRDVEKRGGTSKGGSASVSDEVEAEPYEVKGVSGFQVALTLHTTRQTITFPNEDPETHSPVDVDLTMIVESGDEGWLIAYWGQR